MPAKQQQRAEINTFIQGLITEASPLNFPENASKDEENFELNRDGSRNRRLGMDVEALGTYRNTGISAAGIDEAGISTFKWEEVSGDPSLEFLVLQFNRRIDFYDLNKENLSRNGFLGSISISEFPANTKFSFSSVEGILVAVSGVDSFAVISYENGSFKYYLDRIKIRDMFGVEEQNPRYEEDMSYRGGLDIKHYYNLQNQSWGIPRRAKFSYTYEEMVWQQVPNPNYKPWDPLDTEPEFLWRPMPVTRTGTSTQIGDPIMAYRQHYGFSPSNGEAVWIGMQFTPGQYNGETQKMDEPYEQMFARLFQEGWGSEVKTSRGYYIIDALRRGQSRVEQMNLNKDKYSQINVDPMTNSPIFSSFNLPADYTRGGPSCVAEFAGRMFFSGFRGTVVGGDNRSPNYANYVFFSNLVRNKSDLGRCYQDGDPTGRETADVLDTDGGFLRISEAKDIHTLINMGTGLVVIASNGVWRIDGGSDYGFSATNYRVEKVSSFGGVSPSTVVLENNRVYYWANDGIYTVGTNELGDVTVDSISVGSIQSFYDNIPNLSKSSAVSVYDSTTKKVRWLYNTGFILEERNVTYELILDTTIGAFSVNRVMNLTPNQVVVAGIFETTPYLTGTSEEEIQVGSEQVVAGDQVVINTITATVSGFQATKYLVLRSVEGSVQYSFSLYRNTRFLDWESVNGIGVDAKAFCLTGNQTVGDTGVKKQIPYLILHFEKTERSVDSDFIPQNQSGCLFRGQWGFSDSIKSGQWTPLMQGYRYRKPLLATTPLGEYDNGYEVISTKNKLRGSGKAFSLYFETEPGKDCRLLGWNITMTGNSVT